MKKTALLLAFCLVTINTIVAQTIFRHVTAAANINGHMTTLDHPQLNGNPNAIIFIQPNWNSNGAGRTGTDYQQNPGVWYNGTRWVIFNQNTGIPMPVNMTFNVMVAPAGNSNCFTITCTAASKAGLPANGMMIDHPATNNKPGALLLLTQNWQNVYNDNSQLVSYSNNRWHISNNKYLSPDTRRSEWSTMPVGARFNVMVVENGAVPGLPLARAFMHTTTPENIIPGGSSITFFDQPFLNGNTNAMIWATPNWGWSPGMPGGQTSGPYNESSVNAWYDHPTDAWNYRNGFWSIYNNDGTPLQPGTKFNIVTVNADGGGTTPPASTPLWGFADLHTHPAIHLAFGANSQGKNLFWGRPGMGLASSNLENDLPPCNHDEHAWDEPDPVRRETRKTVSRSLCGEYTGFSHGPGGHPTYEGWPHARSVIHQQMHISWIRRAYEGGLRLLVASVTESQLVAKLWNRGGFDGDIRYDPDYDYNSARAQLTFIRQFADANADWMEIVITAAQARSVIANNRLAVVLALEMDDLSVDQINALADEFGARLVTPIHMINNKIGGAAAYSDLFNSNNKFASGHFYRVKPDTAIDFRLSRPGYLKYTGAGIWQRIFPFIRPLIPVVNLLPLQPLDLFLAFGPEAGIMEKSGISDAEYRELGYDCNAGTPSSGGCVHICDGHKNVLGIRKEQLTRLMQRGLLIDLAHMSESAQIGALELSDRYDYPMLNSHTGIRRSGGSERSIRAREAQRMAARGGVVGLGTEGSNYSRTAIYSRAGSPLVRLTGSSNRWTTDIGPENRIPDNGIIRELVVTIRTGGDDLRGGNDNAIGMLLGVSGRRLVDNLDLNRRAGWGNGSLNTVRVPVAGNIRRSDIRQFAIRTTFGGGIGGDNWNMDEIKVEAIDQRGNRETWIDRRGAPLKRFTGSDQNWSNNIPTTATPIPDNALIQRIDFTIRTGGDDLRGGNDNAFAILVLLGCQNQPVRIPLNQGARWVNGSLNRQSWSSPPGMRLTKADLVAFRLETTFDGGIGGDNWNVDELIVRVTTDRGAFNLISEQGSPFMRFTRDQPAWERLFLTPGNVSSSTPVRCLQLTINTGADDLRGNDDNAFATIELSDGTQHEFPLNMQSNWLNGSTHSSVLCLPRTVPRSQLRSLTIRTTFGGGVSGDNWNINAVQLDAITDDPVAVWTRGAAEALSIMGNRGLALGTDINGLAPQMPFSTQNVSYPLNYQPRIDIPNAHRIGNKTLDFTRDGLAHIGMLPDFIQLVRQSPNGAPVVDALFRSAEDFVRMWERVETAAASVNPSEIQNQVVTLNLTLQTGGDDLRGGNDNAYAYIHLRDGAFYEFPLNNGANWSNGSRNNASFALPHGKTQQDIAIFGIRTTSGGGVSGDNWNLDSVNIQYSSVNGGSGSLLSRSGTPLVRFTGSNRDWRVVF